MRRYYSVRWLSVRWVVLIGLLLLSAFSSKRAPAAEPSEPSDTAKQLVREALESAFVGDLTRRDRLLEQALEIAPDCPEARWQAGYLQAGDKWLAVNEFEKQEQQLGLAQEYRRLRDATPETAEGQSSLARWCEQNDLLDQERFHWYRVLSFAPLDREARRRLETLETRADRRAALRKAAKDYEDDLKKWSDKLTRIRSQYCGNDEAKRDLAIAELRKIDTADSIPALEKILSKNNEALAFESLGIIHRIHGQQATDSLIRHALYSDFSTVRAQAARHLKDRDRFAFLPQMLGAMAMPVQFSVSSTRVGNVLGVRYMVAQERADHVVASQLVDRRIQPSFGGPTAMPLSSQLLLALSRQASANADATDRMNIRVISALRIITGKQLDSNPQSWWKWWYDENGMTGYENKAFYARYVVRTSAELPAWDAPIVSRPFILQPTQWKSCFAAGTPVWTETGSVPIESLRPGDRVLAQNPETGELAYKLVLDTTYRSPGPSSRLILGQDAITATSGHPVWVVRDGWRMVKELKVGDWLHSVKNAVPIDAIEEGPVGDAYNLVVEDFHTYFAGESRLLVHDNTARQATSAPIPGLLGEP